MERVQIKGKRGIWKIDMYGKAWLLDDGLALDRLVKHSTEWA